MDTELIKTRLNQIGYEVSSCDIPTINYISKAVEHDVKRFCDIDVIPDELTERLLDKICGEFLKLKRQTDKLDCFELEQLVEAIKMGDTSVTIKGKSSADLLDDLIKDLVSRLDERIMKCYRRIRWQ